jgi:exopolysaccharide biosynthesis polyprenyl glycosylphosphotransferase
MSELNTNRLWDAAPQDAPSQFARMIPGASVTDWPKASATTPFNSHVAGHVVPTRPENALDEITQRNTRAQTLHRRRANRNPNPGSSSSSTSKDRLLLQSATVDLLVLILVWGASSFLFPTWRLPWSSLPVFAALVILFGFSEGLYKSRSDLPPAAIAPTLERSTLFAMALVLIAQWDKIRLLAAVTIFAGSLSGLILWRALRCFAARRTQRETELRKILIVGGGPIAHSIARTLRNDQLNPYRTAVCGFVDDDLPLSPTVLGRIADLDWLARAEFIDEVILALPGQPNQAHKAAEIAYRNHLDIRAVPDLPTGPWCGPSCGQWCDSGIDHIGEVPVVTLHRELLPSTALFLKRLLDIGGAGIGLAVAGPLMALIALLIRLDSAGSAVYCAERTGVKGRRFRCYKFRSMVTDAEDLKEELRNRNQREGPIFKISDDPRITRVGRVLRRYSLDELPQLWNVLRGEMSLVGPRPHPVDEVNHYELHHYRRLDVKPGITGLWQITGRDCPSFELNMHLDLTYIENWSLSLDLRILASTVRVLFAPEGA